MKFHRDDSGGRNTFTGYGEGYVEVNKTRHGASLVVTGDRLVTAWPATSVGSLAADHIAAIAELQPEIVLLGTGAKLQFPERALLAPLYAAGVGVEVMDTFAACRTYNILLGEGRGVLAAVIVEPAAPNDQPARAVESQR